MSPTPATTSTISPSPARSAPSPARAAAAVAAQPGRRLRRRRDDAGSASSPRCSRRAVRRGQVVDAAMVDGAAVMVAVPPSRVGMWRAARGTNLLDAGAHFYAVYECADGGYFAVGALEPQFYAELLGLWARPGGIPALDRARWPEFKSVRRDVQEPHARRVGGAFSKQARPARRGPRRWRRRPVIRTTSRAARSSTSAARSSPARRRASAARRLGVRPPPEPGADTERPSPPGGSTPPRPSPTCGAVGRPTACGRLFRHLG